MSVWLPYKSRFAALLLLLPVWVGCENLLDPQDETVAKLWIGVTGLMLKPEETFQFEVRAGDRDNNILHEFPATVIHTWPDNLPIRWSSSDPAVVSVSDSGLVRGRSPGRVTIRVEAGGARDSATVIVPPVADLESVSYRMISVGGGHACGLSSDAVAYCWGNNWWGALGIGYRRRHTPFLSPVKAADGRAWIALSTGSLHTCALNAGGAAYCWGSGGAGVLGDPNMEWTEGRGTPVRVAGDLSFVSITAGLFHSCALTGEGVAYCWGGGRYGELGDGNTGQHASRAEPGRVSTDIRFRSLKAGALYSCGLATDGRAFCWGSNQYGELGTNAVDVSPKPVPVESELRFASISTGSSHACGITDEGKAYCWGRNWRGQLGNGIVGGISPVPVPVSGGLTFVAISTGSDHTCGISTDQQAYCWGFNRSGQLGSQFPYDKPNPTAEDFIAPSPLPVFGGFRFETISAGGDFTCGITTDGQAFCWGKRGGVLGNGKLEGSTTPVRMVNPL